MKIATLTVLLGDGSLRSISQPSIVPVLELARKVRAERRITLDGKAHPVDYGCVYGPNQHTTMQFSCRAAAAREQIAAKAKAAVTGKKPAAKTE